METDIMGIVKNGELKLLPPSGGASGSARLTTIQPQAAQAPESGEISLVEYEGQAIMVRGSDQGGWIYSAAVIDVGGPILTAVVREIFGGEDMSGTDNSEYTAS